MLKILIPKRYVTKEIFLDPDVTFYQVLVTYGGSGTFSVWASTQTDENHWEDMTNSVSNSITHLFTTTGTQIRLMFIGHAGALLERVSCKAN